MYSRRLFFFNREVLLLHTKYSVKNAKFNAPYKDIKELDDYRAGF